MFYFDNAATTYPKPVCVVNAVRNALVSYGGNPGRGGHNMAMKVSEKIYSVRSAAADFFHTESQNVVFTQNCTMSLNMAIKGILKEDDHAVISCLEHNAVTRPIHKMQKDGMITYDIAKVYEGDTRKTVRSFENLIQDDTRAIICTHASNVTGVVLPIREIGALCKKYGIIFIVDAAQSAGVLPIDMQECNINILCMPGHKGLYGTPGSGMLLINGELSLQTILEGGTGSLSASLDQPDFSPDRFESGTINTPGILSLGAGMSFIRCVGREKIYRHEFDLCKKVYEELACLDDVCVYNREYVYGMTAPIVSFNIRGISAETCLLYTSGSDYFRGCDGNGNWNITSGNDACDGPDSDCIFRTHSS